MPTRSDLEPTATAAAPRRGRRRDPALDAAILDATLAVLAARGYDGLTIDLVAARAATARASVYRRWPTKAELVLAAVGRLSHADAAPDALPDTGTLRGDLTAMVLQLDDKAQQLRIQAVTALMSLPGDDPRLAAAAQRAGAGPWTDAIETVIARAVARGEFPAPADVRTLAEVMPTMAIARAAQQLPITRRFSLALIDGVILPALRGGPPPPSPPIAEEASA